MTVVTKRTSYISITSKPINILQAFCSGEFYLSYRNYGTLRVLVFAILAIVFADCKSTFPRSIVPAGFFCFFFFTLSPNFLASITI